MYLAKPKANSRQYGFFKAIEVKNQDELIATLKLLKQAVDGGELDVAIEVVSKTIRSKAKPS